MTADVTVDADAANTSITFGTINDDGADGTASNLNLTTNGGAIQTGIIGGTQAVGTIDINASGGAGNVTLAGIGTSDSGSGNPAAGSTGAVNLGNATYCQP